MTLIPIEAPEDFALAEKFVRLYEITSVSLAGLVRRKSENLFFISKLGEGEIPRKPEDLFGLIDFDTTIYHCIPQYELLNQDEFFVQIKPLIKKAVRCISGESKATDFLVNVLSNFTESEMLPDVKLTNVRKFTPKQSNYYKMMKFGTPRTDASLTNQSSKSQNDGNSTETQKSPTKNQNSLITAPTLFNGDQIIRCTENDMEILAPLQKEYMKEEVAFPGRQITDAEVSMMLRQILKNQLCFALVSDGELVAKANTNAIGFGCIQIGGVFTHPLFRRNGYAAALILELCRRTIKTNRLPVLFVKEKNMPAFTLYQKLGFTECGHYQIVYY